MAQTYRVAIQVNNGAHFWNVSDADPPGYGLMDPFTATWTMPDVEHRPTQPDTMVVSFSVIVPTAGELDDITVGDLVLASVWFGPSPAPNDLAMVFYGRIAQGEASPDPRGMIYRFTCADLTADLNGYDLGVAPYAVEAVGSRQSTMLARAGLVETDLIRDPVVVAVDPALNTEAIPQPAAANLLTAMIELWDAAAIPSLDDPSVSCRTIIAPYPSTGDYTSFGTLVRWGLDPVPDAYVASGAAPLPATFGHYFPDPQGWGLYLDPDDRQAGVLDACYVEFESTWTALQPSVADRANVTWLGSTSVDPAVARVSLGEVVRESPTPSGRVPTTTTRETQIFSLTTPPGHASDTAARANAQRLGHMMIPAPQNPAGWAPDGFRWLLYKDPVGLADFPVMFPRHDATGKSVPRLLRTACYVRPMVVAGIPGRWNAADGDRDWVAGQLNAVTLTISDGRPVIDFELAPTIPDQANPIGGTSASWNTQTGTWNAQAGTWDDQPSGHPAFRWTDPALGGGGGGGGAVPYLTEVLADSPHLLWLCNETAGASTAADSSTGGNPGTVGASVTFGTGGTGLIAGYSTAATFLGSIDASSIVDTTPPAHTTGTPYTMEAWIRTTWTGSTQWLWGDITGSSSTSIGALYVNYPAGLARFQAYNSGGTAFTALGTAVVNDGAIHHLVGTYDGATTIRLYVDGVEAATATTTGTIRAYNTRLVAARGTSNVGYFNGQAGGFAKYPSALSAARVAAHYAAGVGAGGTAAPVTWNQLYPQSWNMYRLARGT